MPEGSSDESAKQQKVLCSWVGAVGLEGVAGYQSLVQGGRRTQHHPLINEIESDDAA